MGTKFFSSAKDFDIHGGTMMSASGNINIYNGPANVGLQDNNIDKRTNSNRTGGTNQKSCELYYNSLIVKRHGSPLWIPEPPYNLPIAYQRHGVSIGDVGVLSTSGSFNFFFNIFYPQGHPINEGGVPEGFVPLRPLNPRHVQQLREFNAGSYVASESIVISRGEYNDSMATDLVFESTAEEGAILTMPNGAFSQDVTSTVRLRGYIARNIESWYRYIMKDCECDVDNGDVRLVTGCDKTDSWGMVAFVKSSDTVRLRFQPISTGKSYKWEYSGSFDTRTGPEARYIDALRENKDEPGHAINNQCLFARTLNATLRDDIWKELQRAVYEELGINPEEVIRHDRSISSTMRPQPLISSGMKPHPSKSINERLWEDSKEKYSDMRVIITSDKDWLSVLNEGDDVFPSPGELYKRMMDKKPRLTNSSKDKYIMLTYPPVREKSPSRRGPQKEDSSKHHKLAMAEALNNNESEARPKVNLPLLEESVPQLLGITIDRSTPRIKIDPTTKPIIPGLKQPSPIHRQHLPGDLSSRVYPSSSRDSVRHRGVNQSNPSSVINTGSFPHSSSGPVPQMPYKFPKPGPGEFRKGGF